MTRETADTIERDKAQIIAVIMEKNLTVTALNEVLLTRQAILEGYINKMKAWREFQAYLKKLEISEYYATAKPGKIHKHKISEKALKTFGMEGLIPRLRQLEYEVE